MCGSEGPWFDGCKPHQVNLQKDNGASFTLWLVYMCPAQLTAISVCLNFSNFFYKCKQIKKKIISYTSLYCKYCIHTCKHTQLCSGLPVCRHCLTVLSVCLNCMTCMAAHAFHVIVSVSHIHTNACHVTYTHTNNLHTC